jgi:hypothetical protein
MAEISTGGGGGTTYNPCSSSICHDTTTTVSLDTNHESRDHTTFDCGIERLACRSDGVAVDLGIAWGGVRTVWDFGAGLVSIPGSIWDDSMCRLDPKCFLPKAEAARARADEFWADVPAGVRRGLSEIAFGAADWIGQKHTAFTTGSGFQRAEAMSHFVGDIEVTGLSTIYGIKGLRGAWSGKVAAAGDVSAIERAFVDVAARRAGLRLGTRQAILDAQRAADGKLYDPYIGVEITEGAGQFGHRPTFEWWRTQRMAREQGWTRQQLIEYENDPTHYFYEDPISNMSHQWEAPR